MPVSFQTRSHATITMLNDVAETMLKLMGQSGHVPGALTAEDVPEALSKLKRAVAEQSHSEETRSDLDQDEEIPPISLSQRSLPLIGLLETSIKEGDAVVWEQD